LNYRFPRKCHITEIRDKPSIHHSVSEDFLSNWSLLCIFKEQVSVYVVVFILRYENDVNNNETLSVNYKTTWLKHVHANTAININKNEGHNKPR